MSRIRKAIIGGLAGGLAAIAQGITAGGLNSVNWAVVLGAVLAAGYAVWQTPNAAA